MNAQFDMQTPSHLTAIFSIWLHWRNSRTQLLTIAVSLRWPMASFCSDRFERKPLAHWNNRKRAVSLATFYFDLIYRNTDRNFRPDLPSLHYYCCFRWPLHSVYNFVIEKLMTIQRSAIHLAGVDAAAAAAIETTRTGEKKGGKNKIELFYFSFAQDAYNFFGWNCNWKARQPQLGTEKKYAIFSFFSFGVRIKTQARLFRVEYITYRWGVWKNAKCSECDCAEQKAFPTRNKK